MIDQSGNAVLKLVFPLLYKCELSAICALVFANGSGRDILLQDELPDL